MIRNRHRLESDLLGVLEVGVRPPDLIEPLDGQQLVLPAPPDSYQPQHVLSDVSIFYCLVCKIETGEVDNSSVPGHIGGQSQSVIRPFLTKEDVRDVSLKIERTVLHYSSLLESSGLTTKPNSSPSLESF